MTQPQLLFLRGMNTYGHDEAQMSFMKFGPTYRHFAREFSRRDVGFQAVLGMGVGSVGEMAARAAEALIRMPIWIDDETPVHLLGHSAGGLVARLLVDQFGGRRLRDGRTKIASVTAIAAPHRGSALADLMLEMPTRHRGSAFFCRAIGYDVGTKQDFFREMTRGAVEQTLAHVVPGRHPGVRSAAVVCAPPRARWSRPMKFIHGLRAFRDFGGPSDGMVERESQTFGDRVIEVDLDHFQQAGFFGRADEFGRMCDEITAFVRSEA